MTVLFSCCPHCREELDETQVTDDIHFFCHPCGVTWTNDELNDAYAQRGSVLDLDDIRAEMALHRWEADQQEWAA